MSSKASAPRRSGHAKQFVKDWKRLERSGRYPMQELKDVMQFLIENRGPLPLIYTEPVTTDAAAVSETARRDDGFALSFSSKIIPIEKDENMLAPLFARAARIHALEAPPAAREGCGDCEFFEKIRGLLG